jgi:hypothetical protein
VSINIFFNHNFEQYPCLSVIFRKSKKSPFDVPGIKTKASTKDILEAVRESRQRIAERD